MADSTATAAAAAPAAKPQKPDEALYKEQLAKAEKEHSEVMTKYVRFKIGRASCRERV